VRIIVTGGLGYIGSHTVVELQQSGHEVIIIDNCSNANTDVLIGIKKITGVTPKFIEADIRDIDSMRSSLFPGPIEIDAVIHFAAKKSVGESEQNPLLYYDNNVTGTAKLLQFIMEWGIPRLVFSSSCTVYGEPDNLPVNELEPIKPASSVYGQTKQMCEQMIMNVRKQHTFGSMILRYFNPVGAHPTANIGELPLGTPGNLVPYISQTAAGIRKQLIIHGDDYDTPDGTCIRDYLHVVDLAKAHVMAVTKCEAFHADRINLGTGQGYSVQQIVDTFERVNNLKLNYTIGPRRQGDIASIYNDPTYAKQRLGWEAKLGLDSMLHDAWRWQQKINR
jgi:UDP-glucose 4-epimerase